MPQFAPANEQGIQAALAKMGGAQPNWLKSAVSAALGYAKRADVQVAGAGGDGSAPSQGANQAESAVKSRAGRAHSMGTGVQGRGKC